MGKKTEPVVDEEAAKEDMFKNVPEIEKKKVSDEFPEKDKKAKAEEKIVITPKDLPEKEEEKPKEKEKVRDEFAEREKKPKEEEKIIITPAVLPKKPESESEEEEEEKPEAKKKLSKADLKPSVQIKVAATPEPTVAR